MNAHSLWLIFAAITAVAILILLIARIKLHPFVSLVLVSIALGLAVGMSVTDVVHSFETGAGNTLGHVAIVIALGTMMGKMMAESGGAERVAQTIVRLFGERHVPWAMLLIGLITGLPVFFDVGFVLLIPIVFTVARRTQKSLLLVGLPMVAGLSIVHAFIPPHPAAMAAVVIFQADIGRTIAYALLIGVPCAILAGPLFAMWISPRIALPHTSAIGDQFLESASEKMPGFGITIGTILLPVVLMLLGGAANEFTAPGSRLNSILHLLGGADIALLAGVLVSFITFGVMQGISRTEILRFANESLPPTAGVILLIGAGGGFGRILLDSNVSSAIVEVSQHAHLSVLLTAWTISALMRVATGSSTVAMTTAAGVVAPLALHTPGIHPELLVIATGAGSIVLSHVNDGGFWLVKEYLGMSVPQTLKTWTVLETILSLSGLALVLIVAAIV